MRLLSSGKLRTTVSILLAIFAIVAAPAAFAGCNYRCIREIDRSICFPINDDTANMSTCEEVYRCYGDPYNYYYCEPDCLGDHCVWV